MNQNNVKNVVMVVVLSYITCGIYYYFWVCQTQNAFIEMNDETTEISGGMVVFLSLITCGIYGFYWWYKVGERIASIQQKRNQRESDNQLMYLIVALLGFSVINAAILQNDINLLVAKESKDY